MCACATIIGYRSRSELHLDRVACFVFTSAIWLYIIVCFSVFLKKTSKLINREGRMFVVVDPDGLLSVF